MKQRISGSDLLGCDSRGFRFFAEVVNCQRGSGSAITAVK